MIGSVRAGIKKTADWGESAAFKPWLRFKGIETKLWRLSRSVDGGCF
jgi:hypothetical protein